MIKPDFPNMQNIPGMGAMADSLDFVKNLWSNMGIPGAATLAPGMNIPGMVMPTLSVEEVNKKITDLKAVESWLALNMNMLRGTIQALEVQAATISTLQQMGETFTSTMAAAGAPTATAGTTGTAGTRANGGGNGASGAAESEAPHREKQAEAMPEPSSRDEQDAANLTAPLVNAAAWWNALQDQFQQAVSSAMTTEAPANAGGARKKAKAKPKAKTTASTKSSRTSTSSSASSSTGAGTAARKRKTTK